MMTAEITVTEMHQKRPRCPAFAEVGMLAMNLRERREEGIITDADREAATICYAGGDRERIAWADVALLGVRPSPRRCRLDARTVEAALQQAGSGFSAVQGAALKLVALLQTVHDELERAATSAVERREDLERAAAHIRDAQGILVGAFVLGAYLPGNGTGADLTLADALDQEE
ncbi:hypothetical protein [Fontivita pretiosa]|uniref:hypothetical protein n=1 Tax=Fontivita pretiosa TaxID=2989684 RepID=UPI003D1678AE